MPKARGLKWGAACESRWLEHVAWLGTHHAFRGNRRQRISHTLGTARLLTYPVPRALYHVP